MAKVSPAFTSFSAGEFSPKLDGRVDLEKYLKAAKKLHNFTIQPQGGATRRPGSQFVREVKNSAHNARLIPFEFNVEQAYILEFGDQYFRVHKDGGTVVSSGTPVEFTTPYLHTELADLRFTQSNDVMYVTHRNHPVKKITRTSHTAWTIATVDFVRGPFLDINPTSTTITSGGRTGTVTLTASASLFASTDVGRLVKLHHGYAKISSFTSATSVDATVLENEKGLTELTPAYTASTISFHEGDPSATGNEHNDRLEDTAGKFVDEGFEAGMQISITGSTSNNISNVLIAEVTSTTMLLEPGADLTTEAAASGHTVTGDLVADENFRLGAFSETTGHPGVVALHEQRLIFANTTNQPRTLYFSKSSDFENFTIGTADADSLSFTLASDNANEVRYLQPGRHLQVGTSGGEFTVTSSTEGPLTPTTTQILKQGTYGSANVQPVSVGNATLFTQRAKRKVREFVFDLSSDSYQAPDITLLAEHITEGGIKEVAYQQEPDNVLWFALDNGKMAALTYRREEGVVAWHNHVLGGYSDNCTVTVTDYANIAVGTTLIFTKSDGTTVTFTSEAAGSSAPASTTGFRPNTDNNTTADNIFTAINTHADFTVANPAANVVTIEETSPSAGGVLSVVSSDTTRLATTDQAVAAVESVACVPGDLDEDDFYMVVKRTINSSTKRYVEYLANLDFGDNVRDAKFLDSGLTYNGSPANSISGLSHLEGQTVGILADGAFHDNKVVSSGAVSLDLLASKVHVGLPYLSTLQTMRMDAGSRQGTAQGKIKRIHEVTVRFFRTVGAKVGTSESELDPIFFRSASDPMTSAIELFDGDKEVEFRGGYDQDAHIVIQQDQPLPMTVIGLFPRLITFDE